MNKLLRPIKAQYGDDVQVYMDDVLIATKDNMEYHRSVVKAVLQALKDESFFLKLKKCKFEKRRVEYLGILLDGDTV